MTLNRHNNSQLNIYVFQTQKTKHINQLNDISKLQKKIAKHKWDLFEQLQDIHTPSRYITDGSDNVNDLKLPPFATHPHVGFAKKRKSGDKIIFNSGNYTDIWCGIFHSR